jgi:hypothetical protein
VNEIPMAYHRVYVIERDYGKRKACWIPAAVEYDARSARERLRFFQGRPGEKSLWRLRLYVPASGASA